MGRGCDICTSQPGTPTAKENILTISTLGSPGITCVRGAALRALTLACAIFAGAPAANATVYTYTGNPFTNFTGVANPYTPSDYVHGSFTTASPLAADLDQVEITALVTSFLFHDFDDEHLPIDSSILPAGFFLAPVVTTDGNGDIVYWSINVTDGVFTHYITTFSSPGMSQDVNFDVGDLNAQAGPKAWNNSAPGIWAVTPEPSALLLCTGGCIGLAVRGTRRRS